MSLTSNSAMVNLFYTSSTDVDILDAICHNNEQGIAVMLYDMSELTHKVRAVCETLAKKQAVCAQLVPNLDCSLQTNSLSRL